MNHDQGKSELSFYFHHRKYYKIVFFFYQKTKNFLMQGKRVLGRCVRELVNKKYFIFLDCVVFVVVVSIFFKFYLFIHLFMAVLGLRFCARAFSSCGKWGPLFIAVRGPLIIAASLVAEHRLQTHRLSNCGSQA